MQIEISKKAADYLKKKEEFFLSRSRMPRIVLAGRSCSGAIFRLFFELPQDGDTCIEVDGLKIWVAKDLLDEFEGFDLDLENFFFASRLKIVPHKQSFRCNCDQKCSHFSDTGKEQV
nr:Iron-sulfur cluster biosynthesis [Candidatus Cloacimonadota bacterium]